jgi:hypothetical protein
MRVVRHRASLINASRSPTILARLGNYSPKAFARTTKERWLKWEPAALVHARLFGSLPEV